MEPNSVRDGLWDVCVGLSAGSQNPNKSAQDTVGEVSERECGPLVNFYANLAGRDKGACQEARMVGFLWGLFKLSAGTQSPNKSAQGYPSKRALPHKHAH